MVGDCKKCFNFGLTKHGIIDNINSVPCITKNCLAEFNNKLTKLILGNIKVAIRIDSQ
jgi:hypothetical protein